MAKVSFFFLSHWQRSRIFLSMHGKRNTTDQTALFDNREWNSELLLCCWFFSLSHLRVSRVAVQGKEKKKFGSTSFPTTSQWYNDDNSNQVVRKNFFPPSFRGEITFWLWRPLRTDRDVWVEGKFMAKLWWTEERKKRDSKNERGWFSTTFTSFCETSEREEGKLRAVVLLFKGC